VSASCVSGRADPPAGYASRSRLWPWRLLALAVLALLAVVTRAGALAGAEPGGDGAPAWPPHLDPGQPLATIGSAIRPYLSPGADLRTIAAPLRMLSSATTRADSLPVRLDCLVDAALLTRIQSSGALITGVALRWNTVTVEATLAQIITLSQLPGVRAIALVRPPRHAGQPGTYANQAAGVLHTDQLQAALGSTGAGRTIGVISDSINDTSAVGPGISSGAHPPYQLTQTRPQQAGNLPATIAVVDYGAAAQGHTDEGEAMLEECYHLAPGAGYAFAATGGSQTAMAANISALRSACGCSVICDDIIFLDEPMFQDGPIAQAAAAVVAQGGTYCAAAGNDADAGIITPFTLDAHANLHNWGGGLGDYLPIQVGAGGQLSVVLQWNQPYASYGLGAGAQTDLDLALYSISAANQPSQLIASSSDTQGTVGAPSGDPVEILQFTNTTTSLQTYDLSIPYRHGATAITLRLVASVANASFSSPDYGFFGAGTCYGHAAAATVLAIGAAAWTTPNQLELYSGKGGWGVSGLPFYFDTAGAPLPGAPVVRNKPDLVAPDGVHTSGFGTVLPGDSSGLPSFFGTSAAAANAAAAAELVWSVHPGLGPDRLSAILDASATAITTYPASAAPNAWSGYGLINALAAGGPCVLEVSSHTANGTYRSGTIALQLTFDRPVTVDLTQGVPTIALNASATAVATYSGGSGSSQLLFSYTIHLGDQVPALDAASTSALQLHGGVIRDATTAAVPAVSLLPAPGAPGSLSANAQIAISAVGPALTITPTPAIAHLPGFTFTIAFSHAVLGFGAAQCTIANATPVANGFTAQPDGVSYTLLVIATRPGPVTVSVSPGVVQDASGYPNAGGLGTALYDITPPTVVVTFSPTPIENSENVLVTFTWSKIVSDFTAADITLSNTVGSASALTGNGQVFQLSVIAGTPGFLTVAIAAGSVSDQAGNVLAQDSLSQATVVQGPLPSDTGGSHHCGFGDGAGVIALLGLGWLHRRRRR